MAKTPFNAPWYNVKEYGAKGDLVTKALTGSITSGQNTFTVSGTGSPNTFAAATDIGKTIAIFGAGAAGGILFSTISGVTSGTVVTLANNASTTLSAVANTVFHFATDDTAAIQATIDAIPALDTNNSRMVLLPGGTVYFPPGRYYISAPLNVINLGIKLRGDGGNTGALSVVPATPGLPSTYGGGSRICTNKAIQMMVCGSSSGSPKTQQAGAVVHDLCFEDISGVNLATGLVYNAQTRWNVYNCTFQLLNIGLQLDTNGGDVSWGMFQKCTFGLCNKGVYTVNSNNLGLPNTGVGGSWTMIGGDFQINPGQIGLHHASGNANVKVFGGKFDIHGPGAAQGIVIEGGQVTLISPSCEVRNPDSSTVPITVTGSQNGTVIGGNTINTRVIIDNPYIFNDDTITDGSTAIKILNNSGSTSSPTFGCRVTGGYLTRWNVGVEVGSNVFGTLLADFHTHDFAGTSPVSYKIDSGAVNTVVRGITYGRQTSDGPVLYSDAGTQTQIEVPPLKPQATSGRPAAVAVVVGTQYYDTTLSKPVWSDGTNWRDAAGNIV